MVVCERGDERPWRRPALRIAFGLGAGAIGSSAPGGVAPCRIDEDDIAWAEFGRGLGPGCVVGCVADDESGGRHIRRQQDGGLWGSFDGRDGEAGSHERTRIEAETSGEIGNARAACCDEHGGPAARDDGLGRLLEAIAGEELGAVYAVSLDCPASKVDLGHGCCALLGAELGERASQGTGCGD
ncbi:unannotated protein [freshwater metagenome]|uniref:Unannotated protein n=1 Tax=freshwater metagenome TaxID=449393 RepID=A0A6J7Q7R7_9ZZZZ